MIKSKQYIFFTLNNFLKEGGGTVRMYGVLNSLAEMGHQVTIISNAQTLDKFHPDIIHYPLNIEFTPSEKRKFQFVAGLSLSFLNRLFGDYLLKLRQVFNEFSGFKNIYFFEYLDNSVGYWLFMNGIIQGYSNDIHGIATLEFEYAYKNAKNFKQFLIPRLKYNIAKD